ICDPRFAKRLGKAISCQVPFLACLGHVIRNLTFAVLSRQVCDVEAYKASTRLYFYWAVLQFLGRESIKRRQGVGLGDLFWFFFLLAAFQPLLRQRLLEASRTRMIRELEKRRRSRVIALVHRQETMSLLGFPLVRYIDIEDSEEVLRAIQLTDPNLPIDLILHTPGGLVLAAEQIAHALVSHPAKVTVFVPHYAMSGGTLLALAADSIVMAPHAVLGPLDPQLERYPAASILRAVELQKQRNKDIEDQTLILADMAEKAMNQVREFVIRLLKRKQWDDERARKV